MDPMRIRLALRTVKLTAQRDLSRSPRFGPCWAAKALQPHQTPALISLRRPIRTGEIDLTLSLSETEQDSSEPSIHTDLIRAPTINSSSAISTCSRVIDTCNCPLSPPLLHRQGEAKVQHGIRHSKSCCDLCCTSTSSSKSCARPTPSPHLR